MTAGDATAFVPNSSWVLISCARPLVLLRLVLSASNVQYTLTVIGVQGLTGSHRANSGALLG